MKFRNVTKLQLAFADYEATLEDFDRMQFGMPHAKHEAAESSDAFALKQYALKAMDVITSEKEKKCLKELYNEGMLSAHDYTEAIIESGCSMKNVGLKIAGNFEKELIEFATVRKTAKIYVVKYFDSVQTSFVINYRFFDENELDQAEQIAKEKHSEIQVLDLKNILNLSDEEFELIADGKQNVDLIRQYRKIMDKEKTSL